MAHKIETIRDNLVKVTFIGDRNEADIRAFIQDFQPYLDAVTVDNSLNVLFYSSRREGQLSPGIRRAYADIYKDPRLGHIGVCHVKPAIRVFATFLMKATGRQNIGFFDTEEEALAWLDKGGK